MSSYRAHARRWAATSLLVVFAAVAAAANTYQMLIEQAAPALVTVKYVLKAPGSDQQMEREVTGVALNAEGLILVANTRLGYNPFRDVSPNPTDIKIIIGDDAEGLEAEVVIRDSELDLAWLQITEEIVEPLKYLDLTKSGAAEVGEEVYALRLLDKYYGRKPLVTAGRISGVVTKPRDLLVPPMHLYAEQGLPVFTSTGAVIGVLVIQVPDEEARRASGGQMSTSDVRYILAADKVAQQTKLAQEEYQRRKAEQAELEAIEAAEAEPNAPAETDAE